MKKNQQIKVEKVWDSFLGRYFYPNSLGSCLNNSLKEAPSTSFTELKHDGDVKLWLVKPYDDKQYYVITIEVDDSTRIKVIEPRKAKALWLYKKAVRKRKNYEKI